MLRTALFLIIKFILGGESGASFSWSAKWQDKKPWFSEIPEALDALILAHMAVLGWSYFFDMSAIHSVGISHYHVGLSLGAWLFPVFFAISYAGIQSATWMFLRWESHDDPNTTRSSTTKPAVDWLAEKIGGWRIGDEGYAWVAATVKGTIICLPMGGPFAVIGGLLFALGYEIGSHAYGRTDKWFNPHIVSEGMSFVGLGVYAIGFVQLCQWLGSI